jgi:hypothetical protein
MGSDTVRDSWYDSRLGGSERVPLDRLVLGESPRFSANEDHVHALAAVDGLPPIIVHRPTRRVVDGQHRLRAARLRGDTEIDVRWYEGTSRDILPIAVQANVVDGLPLSAAERRAATAHLLRTHASWSDRMIAAVVGFSPGTVRALRERTGGTAQRRVGRDGRSRPISSAESRRRAGALLTERPGMSLREVAGATGLAPSTVLDVRKRLRAGQDLVPNAQRRAEKAAVPPTLAAKPPADRDTVIRMLRLDPSLRLTAAGRQLLMLLSALPDDGLADRLPAHCLPVIAEVARENLAAWQSLVSDLERRSKRG